MISEEKRIKFLHKYAIPWETMNTIVGGTSPIDLEKLYIRSEESAERFITNYGFDYSDPQERFDLRKLYHRAVEFIQEFFLSSEPKLRMPEFFHDLGDVRQLLIMVSDSHPQRDWACGILRVMHTMAHAENFLNREYFPEIRRQIVSRFQRHVFVDSNGKLWLGEGERRVQLVRWDVKEEKTFESVVLKLIAKPENVAEDIFDRLGFRIVTETKMEALLAIKYLRAFHIIMFPNIKPTRSRNTLLGMDKVRERVDKIFEKYFNGELSEEETVQQYYLIDEPPSVSRLEQQKANPFSREFYSSIQFTCRQLVRLSHPLVPHLEQMKGIISSVSDDEAKKRLLSIIEHIPIQPYLKLFFPFEMQVMDEESYHLNMEGLASYEEYKAAQLGAAKKRVLGPLLV